MKTFMLFFASFPAVSPLSTPPRQGHRQRTGKPLMSLEGPVASIDDHHRSESSSAVSQLPHLPKSTEFLMATGLGVLGALLLAPLWMHHPLPHSKATPLDKVVKDLTNAQPSKKAESSGQESSEFVSFLSHPMALLLMIPLFSPRLTRPAIAVTALLGLGYMGSNALNGVQEVWLRWQESRIRANLVAHLDQAYQQSIEAKMMIDEENHRYAEEHIRALLKAQHIEDTERYFSRTPLNCPPSTDTHQMQDLRQKQSIFAMLPQNRKPLPRQARVGETSSTDSKNAPMVPLTRPALHPTSPALDFHQASRLGLNLLGLGLGLSMTSIGLYAFKVTRDFITPLSQEVKKNLENNPQAREVPLIKMTLAPQNTEAVLLHFFQKKEGFIMGGLFITFGVMLKLLQFLTESLREIEVTHLNAETEKQYETYKFTVLEPHFKAISERSQLNHALQILEQDLKKGTLSPEDLQQRIQSILDNIGYNWSAPNYYPMSPVVQLVPARS
jgi:hypothetical protein